MTTGAEQANRYWLTEAGCAAAGGHTAHDATCQTCVTCGAPMSSGAALHAEPFTAPVAAAPDKNERNDQ